MLQVLKKDLVSHPSLEPVEEKQTHYRLWERASLSLWWDRGFCREPCLWLLSAD